MGESIGGSEERPPPRKGAPSRKRAPSRARRRRAVGAVTASIVLLAVVGLPVYVFPTVDAIEEPGGGSRVAYVIGPPTEERIELAEQLRDDEVVDAILISVPHEGGQSAAELRACAKPSVTCRTPDPLTTAGEAALLDEYTRTRDADHVVVITFTPHVARTRFVFATCYSGTVTVLAAPTRLDPLEWTYQYAYQTTAFVKAVLEPCSGSS